MSTGPASDLDTGSTSDCPSTSTSLSTPDVVIVANGRVS
jgi:hypothetical protein